MRRREFFLRSATGAAVFLTAARAAAQQQGAANVPMDQGAARNVRRPPKPNARPSMSDRERDDKSQTKPGPYRKMGSSLGGPCPSKKASCGKRRGLPVRCAL